MFDEGNEVMRAKTVKRLGILIAVFILAGGSAYAIWKFQVEKMAKGVVDQADRALEEKEFDKAVDLFRQHLLVFPDDEAVKLKYADTILKQPTPKHQADAMAIYNEVLNREPARTEVRRRAAELAFQMDRFESARVHLSILLKSAKEDGHLEYMMGRCSEADKDRENAAQHYRAAIAYGGPDRIEAARQLAKLIREGQKLGTPEDADKVIEAMVEADPKNYRVYLARGRYRNEFNLKGAEDDFRRSLELAPDHPETYVEVSELAERSKALEDARRVLEPHRPFTFLLPTATDVASGILDKGLAAIPDSAMLYQARAEIERKAGRFDRYIEYLERGVKTVPQNIALRLQLAVSLAARGDTGKLQLQIDEMKGLGVSQILLDYFTAYYHFNKKEFERSKEILAAIQAGVAQSPELKGRVNMLLSRCYAQLHEPQLQWEANQRAYNANPNDMQALSGWLIGYVNRLVGRGEIDEAIREYRRQIERAPQLDRMPLVDLMRERNRRLPQAQRNWREVEELVNDIEKASPRSVHLLVLRAILRADQDQDAKVWEALEAARSEFPKAVEPWTAEADLLVRQKKFDEALGRLDDARKALGDRVELRLARAVIWVGRGVPKEELVEVLKDLAKDLDPFPKEKRRNLLAYLATQLAVLEDAKDARALWSRLAEDDPENVNPHLQLFELAMQAAGKAGTDKQEGMKAEADIAARLKAIDAIDATYGRFCRARYLTLQASRSKDDAERKRLRAEARALLSDLKARRDEWEMIPTAEAALQEQELAETGSDEALKREKREALIATYRGAIELGSRNPDLVRRTVALLLASGRSLEAVQLMGQVPVAPQLGNDLMRLAASAAGSQDDQQAAQVARKAEEIARQAIAANPDGLQERLWLVNILANGRRVEEAEAELRQAVARADGDPVRWLTLVNFLIQNKQLPKAEQAIRDAEKKLPQAPQALAECCELMWRAMAGPNGGLPAKRWHDESRRWFEKALAARKDPKDLTVTRQFVRFLLDAKHAIDAEDLLKATLDQGTIAKDATGVAWARRTLALVYISESTRKPAEALALLDAAGAQGAGADPEDRRVRVRVLEAQGTPERLREAIRVLESLVDEKLATLEDVQRLARFEEAAGEWPKARDRYRKLIERVANNAGDRESRNREIFYVADFAERLLQSRQSGDDRDKDLAEAREQIERLKRLQPDQIRALNLEVALFAARNDFQGAAALIRSTAERPDLNPNVLPELARMAERIGQSDQFKLAEELYRKFAFAPGAPFAPNKVGWIQFLTRRRRFPEILELCESLRKNPADRGSVDLLCITIFADPGIPAQAEQVNRVIGWLEEERRNGQRSLMYQLGLGNLYERAGQDGKAEAYYRAIVNSNAQQDVASNNLAWLMTLNGNRWTDALPLINHAIEIKGPIPDYLDTRAVVYLAAGDYTRAIEDLKAAINEQPTASKYFHLAQAYLAGKDKANARKNLELALGKGLPNGLHRLEQDKYKQVRNELEIP